jgi:hypothetical protein
LQAAGGVHVEYAVLDELEFLAEDILIAALKPNQPIGFGDRVDRVLEGHLDLGRRFPESPYSHRRRGSRTGNGILEEQAQGQVVSEPLTLKVDHGVRRSPSSHAFDVASLNRNERGQRELDSLDVESCLTSRDP